MNQTSPMNTATAAGAAAVLAPVISWLASLAHVSMPPEVLSSIVVLLVAGAHWLGNFLTDYAARRASPSTQGASQ